MKTFTENITWTIGNRPPRTGTYLAFGVSLGRSYGTVYEGFYNAEMNSWILPDNDCGSRECCNSYIRAWAEQPNGPRIDYQSGEIVADEEQEEIHRNLHWHIIYWTDTGACRGYIIDNVMNDTSCTEEEIANKIDEMTMAGMLNEFDDARKPEEEGRYYTVGEFTCSRCIETKECFHMSNDNYSVCDECTRERP